jgi:hypothetical protein
MHWVGFGGSQNDGKKQPANATMNTGLENKEKRKRECDLPDNTAQHSTSNTHTQDATNTTKKKNNMNTHTRKKVNKKRGDPRTRTAWLRVRGSLNETTHGKVKKKNKRDPDQCNRKKEAGGGSGSGCYNVLPGLG